VTGWCVRLGIGVFVFLISSMLPEGARAQSIVTGELVGSVVDSAGRPVPGALVTLRAVEGASGALETTGTDGSFTFGFVLPGGYELQAEALGWRPLVVDMVRVAPAKQAAIRLVLTAAQPPVERRDTLPGAALPVAADAALAWLDASLIEALPARDPQLASLIGLGGTIDEQSGMEGLPESLVTLHFDGHQFHPARHPWAASDPARGILVPRSAVRSASLPRATDIEWAEGAGVVALSTGVRREGVPALFGLWAGDAGWRGSALAGDPPAFTSWWAGGGTTLALVRDTARVHIAFETGVLQRPLAPLASDSVLAPLDEEFPDLASTALAESSWTSGSLKLDWGLGNGGVLEVSMAGATFSEDSPGRAAPSLRYDTPSGAVEGTDGLVGVNLAAPLRAPLTLELRAEGALSRRIFGREGEAPGSSLLLVDPRITIGGPPNDPGEVRRTEIGGTAALHYARGPHRGKFGVHASVASHRFDLLDQPRGMFLFGAPDGVGNNGVFAERAGTLPPVTFSVPSGNVFAQYRWSADGVELTMGGRMGLSAHPVKQIPLDEQFLELSGYPNTFIRTSSRQFGGIAHGAWDPTARGRTVLQAGIGLEYGEVDPAAFWEAIGNSGTVPVRRVAGDLPSWPDAPPPDAGNPASSLSILDPVVSPPRTSRALVGLAQRLAGGVTVRIEASTRLTEFLLRRVDLNAPIRPTLTGEGNRPVLSPVESWGGVVGPPGSSWRRFSEYDAIWGLNGDGWSRYRGVTVGLDGELGRRGLIALSYTYSETTDNLVGLAAGDPSAALTPLLGGGTTTTLESPSDLDIPHRAAATVSLNFGRLANLGAAYRGRSGSPFTPMVAHGLDVNGDGSWTNDVAWIPENDTVVTAAEAAGCSAIARGALAARNSCRGPVVHELDLRLALGPFTLGRAGVELTFDVINATDQEDGVRDDALFLLDTTKPVTTAAGRVSIPYRVNPGFGSLLARADRGRQLRLGLRLGALR
jgi:hypothetical protein